MKHDCTSLPHDINAALDISDSDLAALRDRYSPLVLVGDYDRAFHEIGDCDPRNVAYAWSPVLGRRVSGDRVGAFLGAFRFGAPAFFKPSIAEVLSQLRFAAVPASATHYYVDGEEVGFHTPPDTINTYHTAVVTLWAMPKDVSHG